MSRVGQFSDGAWDCSHAWDAHTHREAWIALGRPTDPEAARNVVDRAWGSDVEAREAWIAQNGADVIADSGGTVDPNAEYDAWRDAWKRKAISYTRAAIEDWSVADE